MLKKTDLFWVISGLALALVFNSCAHVAKNTEENALQANTSEGAEGEDAIAGVIEEDLPPDAELVDPMPDIIDNHKYSHLAQYAFKIPQSDLPVVINDKVLAWIDYFTGDGRAIYQRWLDRQTLVKPHIDQVLKTYGLPQDIIYLSMIESGFNFKAYSRAGAAGAWQFMKGTGKRYGLKVDHWVDERRDLEKATDAAVRHLRDLYVEFNDWNLAFAAYNAGSGKVTRAFKRHHTRDYWELVNVKRPYLRAETRNYVPKLYAALIIGKQISAFGFMDPAKQVRPEFEMVEIEDATDLNVIAKCAEVDVEVVKDLNTEIKSWYTPPRNKTGTPYQLRIPKGTKEKFELAYAQIPANERVTFRQHVLQPGQTLGYVARRYGTSVDAIMRMNNIANPRRIRLGKALIIPIRKGDNSFVADGVEEDSPPTRKNRRRAAPVTKKLVAKVAVPAGATLVEHKVSQGDTLWALSQRYQVSVSAIRSWNDLRRTSRIVPGDVLAIYIPKNS